MTKIRSSYVFVLLASVTGLTLGCSGANGDSKGGIAADDGSSIPASAETTAALGIARWEAGSEDGRSFLQGNDEQGGVKVRFESTLTEEASGAKHGEITDGRSVMRFTAHTDGSASIERNDFTGNRAAVDAVRRATADYRNRAPTSLQNANSLNLAPQGGLLEKCVNLIGAAVVVLSPLGECPTAVATATCSAAVEQSVSSCRRDP